MTTTADATDKTEMQLAPYLFFYGRCEEALEHYKNVLGGTYELVRVKDSPMAERVPPDARDGVMHATFTAPGMTFLATDGPRSRKIDPDEGNIALALTVPDSVRGQRIFDAFAEGGSIQMPLHDAFWGGRFGVLHDRFGTEWMISTP